MQGQVLPVRSTPRSIRAIGLSWSEARPPVLGVFSLRFAAGGAMARSSVSIGRGIEHGLLGQAGWLAAVWGIYLLNGITDLTEDRANGSTRPLASGRLSSREAVGICLLLTAACLGLASSGGWALEVCSVLLLLLGAAYSLGKAAAKQRGDAALLIAALGAALSYVGGAAAYDGRVPVKVLIVATALACWIMAAGPLKDLSDLEGDRLSGRRTLPIQHGVIGACRIVAVRVGLVAVAGTAVAVVQPIAAVLLLLLPAGAAIAVAAFQLRKDDSRSARRRPYRVFMATQYLLNGAVLLAAVPW